MGERQGVEGRKEEERGDREETDRGERNGQRKAQNREGFKRDEEERCRGGGGKK